METDVQPRLGAAMKFNILGRNGQVHGPFYSVADVRVVLDANWRGEEQDDDHPGPGKEAKGWDVKVTD